MFREFDPAFVNDSLIFFLQFQENDGIVFSCTITAKPDLFLIDRTFQRFPDQSVIRRIVVDIADRAFSMWIREHIVSDSIQEFSVLFLCNHIFDLMSIEYVSDVLHVVHLLPFMPL